MKYVSQLASTGIRSVNSDPRGEQLNHPMAQAGLVRELPRQRPLHQYFIRHETRGELDGGDLVLAPEAATDIGVGERCCEFRFFSPQPLSMATDAGVGDLGPVRLRQDAFIPKWPVRQWWTGGFTVDPGLLGQPLQRHALRSRRNSSLSAYQEYPNRDPGERDDVSTCLAGVMRGGICQLISGYSPEAIRSNSNR